jgi:hypothetical protein
MKDDRRIKFAAIGVLIAALAAPAAAVGHRARQHHARAASSCQSGPVFLSAKDYTFCGPQLYRGTVTVWVRDPQTGRVVAVPRGGWLADAAERR